MTTNTLAQVAAKPLLPCPFCGTSEMLRIVGANPGDGWGFVRCDYCDAEGPDPDNLPGGWNTRAEKAEAGVARLTEELARKDAALLILGAYLLQKGESFRVGEGAELLDAYSSALTQPDLQLSGRKVEGDAPDQTRVSPSAAPTDLSGNSRAELEKMLEWEDRPGPRRDAIVAALSAEPTDNTALVEALDVCLEWIDAVPSDTRLPAMPGFDRDWVDNIRNRAALASREAKPAPDAVAEAAKLADDIEHALTHNTPVTEALFLLAVAGLTLRNIAKGHQP